MSVNIILPPKPEVILELESGGSLQASTTYHFVCWWQGLTMPYYGGYAGEGSNEVTITTDSTNKSIRMWVTWDSGTVASFASGGTGITTVTSNGHGLINNEKVIIRNTTNYDELYTISNSTTNTFDISATYSSTETGDWYGVGPPSRESTSARGFLFMWDTAELASKMPWNSAGGTAYGHRRWYKRVGLEQGITGTSILLTEESSNQLADYPTNQSSSLCSQKYTEHPAIGWDYSRVAGAESLDRKAKFAIRIDGTGNTWSDVITALNNDSRVDNLYFYSRSVFVGFCALYGDADAELTIEGQSITLLAGAWSARSSELKNSSLHIVGNYTWINPSIGVLDNSKVVFATSGSVIADNISAYATLIKNSSIGYMGTGGTVTNYSNNVDGFTIYNRYQLRYIGAGATFQNIKLLNSVIKGI